MKVFMILVGLFVFTFIIIPGYRGYSKRSDENAMSYGAEKVWEEIKLVILKYLGAQIRKNKRDDELIQRGIDMRNGAMITWKNETAYMSKNQIARHRTVNEIMQETDEKKLAHDKKINNVTQYPHNVSIKKNNQETIDKNIENVGILR